MAQLNDEQKTTIHHGYEIDAAGGAADIGYNMHSASRAAKLGNVKKAAFHKTGTKIGAGLTAASFGATGVHQAWMHHANRGSRSLNKHP